jgi:NADH-quinone oxidoreductase subunit G
MTRCIQCTRCVRFGDEIAGLRELGAYNRGEHLEIGTYVERAMKSELSGNVIDVCPVGALTSKPYRFAARAWEMIQHPSIAPHDCIGSNIYVHTRGEEYSKIQHVMRVVPRANEAVNEMWLSDRDRYSYEGLNSTDRVVKPLLKQNGKWQEADWTTTLNFIVDNLKNIIKQQGAENIAAIASPNSTTEEFYLLQKLMRSLRSHNIDHRIHQFDFSDQQNFPSYPNLGIALEDIENLDTVLLIGSDIRREQPLGCHRVRKAALQGAQVMCINPIDYVFNFDVAEKNIVSSELLSSTLAKVAKSLLSDKENLSPEIKKLIDKFEPNKKTQPISEKLKQGKKIAIFLGPHALNHPQAATIRALANIIAKHCGATVGYLTEGANSAGAWLAGAIPHRKAAGQSDSKPGLDAKSIFEKSMKAYLLLNIEPELDCANSAVALSALKQANLVIYFSPFISSTMKEYANVILPITPFTETDGTFVNAEGLWQHFEPVSPALGESRPAWKVLRVLGNLFGLEGFEYTSAHEIRDELRVLVDKMPKSITTAEYFPEALPTMSGIFRIAEWPMYRIDNLVRRSKPLQDTIEADVASIRINSTLAKQLNLTHGEEVVASQNGSQVTLPIFIDDRIADNNVFIPAGIAKTAGFGSTFGKVELRSGNRV